jgi:diguanylate cyclase (GGDEF)-like protein
VSDEKNNGEKPRVLLADDSRVVRMSAGKILRGEFDVVLVADGEQAWQHLGEDDSIRAVFTDLGMPKLDGYGLLQRIREASDERVKELPVIVVTGNEGEEARQEALDRGATDFIAKPFNRLDLLARARSHARYQQTKTELQQQTRELEESSMIDPLTRIGNGRYFLEKLAKDRSFTNRHGQDLSLIRLDLCDLQKLVKEHGKPAVAGLLRRIAAVIVRHVRNEDTPTRIGGGRFAIVLPACDAAGARIIANRISEVIAGHEFKLGEQTKHIDVAIAITTPSLERAKALADLVAELDRLAASAGTRRGIVQVPDPGDSANAEKKPAPPALGIDQALAMLERGDQADLMPHLDQLIERVLPLFRLTNNDQRRRLLARLKKLFS